MSLYTGSTGMVRIDATRNVEYLKPPKPKFSLGRFLGKAISFLGPIGAAVTAVAGGPVGLPIAAGIMGATRIAGKLTYDSEMKAYGQKMADHQQMSQLPVVLPGLFEQASAVDVKTEFMIPQTMLPTAQVSMVQRELGNVNAVQNFNF